MPPKKDAKKDAKKADLSPEERMAFIEQTLEGEKNNLVSKRNTAPQEKAKHDHDVSPHLVHCSDRASSPLTCVG